MAKNEKIIKATSGQIDITEFLKDFPKGKIAKWDLVDYTGIGGNQRKDFTYCLEHKLDKYGSIKGSDSYKFGIYQSNKKPKRKNGCNYSIETNGNIYAWKKQHGENKDDAFTTIKGKICNVVKFASQKGQINYDKIEEIALDHDPYKWKIAFLYSNNRLVPVYKKEVLEAAAKKLDVYPDEETITIAKLQEVLMKYYNNHTTEFDNNICSFGKHVWTIGNSDNLIREEEQGTDDDSNGKETEPHHPLNLILYGPPGTGKTYNTVNKALDIVEPNWRKDFEDQKSSSGGEKDERKYAQQRFDYYKDTTGQIVFTTFHQSMSYEDFIEGIKPIADDTDVVAIHNNNNSKSRVTQFGNGTTKIENLSKMKYEVKDGIFKQICVKARKSSEITHTIILNDVFDYFCFDIEKYGSNIELYRGNVKYRIKEVAALKNGNYDVIRFDRNKAGVRLEVLRDNYDDYKNGKIKSPSDIKYGHNELAFGLLQEIEKFENNKYPKYKGKIDATKKQKKENYVLIIDEINRGNVAQIFGELITLIEPSKRLDNAEPLTATLPYSPDDEPFGVPNNLYIIGTMNTADRSVEALDTALRRRFSFKEMMPDPELLKDDNDQFIEVCGVKLSELLKTINDRIVALKDREHQIGHSYFMGCETEDDLKNVFKDKIIPLLQEYFYGDYKKIYYVLGPGFVEKKTEKTIFAVENPDYDEFDIPEERYDIASFDAKFNIKDAIVNMKVQKLDSGTGTMSTEATTIETGATAESEESTDKE